jgi:hypothetical protein
MSWKGCGASGRLILCTALVLAWRYWKRPRKTLVKIVSVPAEIRTQNLQNTSQNVIAWASFLGRQTYNIFVEKLMVIQQVKKSLYFMKPQGLSPWLQKSAIWHCSQLVEYYLQPHALFREVPLWCCASIYFFMLSLLPSFCNQKIIFISSFYYEC